MGGGSIVGGRYQLVRKLAEGGMGAVWEAQHTLSKKTVALKLLNAETVRDETTRARFLREVAAPAQIGHDGIVEVYDAGFDVALGSLFVAMELLEGETLRALMMRGRVPPQRYLEIVLEILGGLAAAHAAGFIHRDLKPENIFLHHRRDGTDRVKILDFGIARSLDQETSVTQSGVAMGTPHYMSPEQASSARDVTPATDVWAMGVILYEGLVHETPFRGDTLASLVVDVLTRPHRPTLEAAPGTPPAIAAVVDRCLEKDPKRRPKDATELYQVLASAAQSVGLGPRPAPAPVFPPAPNTIDHGARAATMLASEGMMPPPSRATAPTLGMAPGGALAAGPGATLDPRPTGEPRPLGVATEPPSSWGAPASAPGLPPTTSLPSSVPTMPATSPAPTLPSATPLMTGVPSAPSAPAAGGGSRWLWIGLLAGGLFFVMLLGVAGLGLVAYSFSSRTVRGTLAGGDLTLAGGQLYDSYDYEWRAGGRLQLHASSAGFEPHIILNTPSGRQLDSNDSDGARIDMTLTESGIYRVIVTSRRAFQLGDYTLDVDAP